MVISLDDVISEAEAASDAPLAQLQAASDIASTLAERGDTLLTHFVDKCRRNGHTWAEIGQHLGVTRQAVQKRFAFVLDRFTGRARAALDRSVEVARAMKHNYVGTEHLLLALFDIDGNIGAAVLERAAVTRGQVEDALAERIAPGSTAVVGEIPFTPRVRRTLTNAIPVALELGHNYVGTEHLLLALLRIDGLAHDILGQLGLSESVARAQVVELLAAYRPSPT